MEKDVHYDFPDFIYYDTINKDTTLVVPDGVTLTIGKKGLQMNGTLRLRGGTVDLEKSEEFYMDPKCSGVRWTCD